MSHTKEPWIENAQGVVFGNVTGHAMTDEKRLEEIDRLPDHPLLYAKPIPTVVWHEINWLINRVRELTAENERLKRKDAEVGELVALVSSLRLHNGVHSDIISAEWTAVVVVVDKLKEATP